MGKIGFIKGLFKFLFYPKISLLSFVSSDCKIDKTSVIYRFTKIKDSKIGRYSYISANSDISSTDIGNFCSIADHVTIGLPSHTLSYLSTSPIFTMASNALKTNWIKGHNDYFDEDLRTYIGNDVWIGSHVLIKAGVRIHEGSVIGAGAVVTKDVPPYTIVGGVPAKIIRKRFDSDTIEKIRSINWWSWPDDKLKKQIKYFQTPNIDVNKIDNLNE